MIWKKSSEETLKFIGKGRIERCSLNVDKVNCLRQIEITSCWFCPSFKEYISNKVVKRVMGANLRIQTSDPWTANVLPRDINVPIPALREGLQSAVVSNFTETGGVLSINSMER